MTHTLTHRPANTMYQLRDYQVEVFDASIDFLNSDQTRAQIYSPTGSGKTVCFEEVIKKSFSMGYKSIAVLHPRLALSQDQLSRFKKTSNTAVRYTSFHSGEHVIGSEQIKERATTDPTELNNIIEKTNNDGMVHLTFSSYHSFGKLIDKTKFDLVICDEAHYMVRDQFYKWVDQIPSNKIMFFTATPITNAFEYDPTEQGMLNYDVFGEVICAIEPKRLIKAKYIVAPLIHKIECSTTQLGEDVDIIDLVARSFVHQYQEMVKSGMTKHHMLVAARNVARDLRDIESGLVELWRKIKELDDTIQTPDVYTIDAGQTNKNNQPLASRVDAMNEIKRTDRNVILVHYDVLSEGIDIDSLSGVLLMRVMSKAKLIQTIGRCSRPFRDDMDMFMEPRAELFVNGQDLRKKPRSLVTIPVIDGKWIANSDSTLIVEAFIAAGYDDIMTYMPKEELRPSGNKRPLLVEEYDHFNGKILQATVDRQLVDLLAVFDKFMAKAKAKK